LSQLEVSEDYVKPESIIFILRGEDNLNIYFEHLKKQIKRKFRKSKVAIRFNSIETNKSDFDAVVYLSISNFESNRAVVCGDRIMNYDLNLKMYDTLTNKIMINSKIFIVSLYYIFNEVNRSARVIKKIINQD